MDCESDESERWEDFFGSSTDISPSVIAYYDRLSSSTTTTDDSKSIKSESSKTSHSASTNSSSSYSNSNSFSKNPNGNGSLHRAESRCINQYTRCIQSNDLLSSTRSNTIAPNQSKSLQPPPPLPKLPPPTASRRHHRNFRALSANVQRLISSHSNTALDSDGDIMSSHSTESLNGAAVMATTTTTITPPTQEKRYRKRIQSPSQITLFSSSNATSVGSKFKHPLSKNTCKLTRLGNADLIIDDSDGGYVTPPETLSLSSVDERKREKNGNADNDDSNEDYDDIEKTPTNEHSPMEFVSTEDLANSNDMFYAQIAEVTCPDIDDCHGNDDNSCLEESLSICEEENHYETIMPISLKNSNSFIHSVAVNKHEQTADLAPTEQQPPVSPATSLKSTGSDSRMGNASKSQLFAIRALSEQGTKESSSSDTAPDLTANFVPVCNDDNNNSNKPPLPLPLTEPTNSLQSNKNSKQNDHLTTTTTTTNPGDSKRMKARPLSSVSISSTSSSSSSASDEHSPNQNAISYLASVESLADHSESELAPLSNSWTVLERACMEMIDSERSYVDDLGQVIKGYLNDWKERACLKTADLDTLFGNIQQVYDFNVILLGELEHSQMEPAKIAKCFIKLKDKFDAYTHYCTSYPDAISLLTTLLQASHTNALLTTTQKILQHTLPLGSYLLKPVQRILKYHLLLDNLRKHCDVAEVAQAHEIMKNVARHIDQVKRNLEQQSRVRELSGILDGWLGPELTVLGDLILEGLLMESNKPRIVLLFETMLIITKKKEDNRLQFKTYIHCKHLMLIEHFPGEPASFSVIPYNDMHPNQIKLTARNRDQKRQWAQHIKQVMLAHFDIPNRAKELLFKLGEEEDRTPDKNTWKWTSTSSSATPEYLERRNQYRRSEMRYRSKKQRKIFSSGLSLIEDGQFEKLNATAASNDTGSKAKVLDSMIKELQERNSTLVNHNENDHIADSDNTEHKPDVLNKCDVSRVSSASAYADEEMPFDADKALPNRPATALEKAKSKLLEVRMYNTKTLPKRIANLKKQRSKTLKETSRFYMDLPEESTETVLKITESSDDIAIDDNDQPNNRRRASLDATDTVLKTGVNDNAAARKLSTVSLITSPTNFSEHLKISKNKRDIDIISELLKDHKEFDRILKKPPKKLTETEKSTTTSTATSHELKSLKFLKNDAFLSALNANTLRLPLPPIPTEADDISERLSNLQKQISLPEPIYESLLRNVHVPYKFPSPILSRSLSQPNGKFLKIKRPTEAPPKRPDSDYVMLTYDANGELAQVDDDDVLPLPKHGSHFRKSDTNINYHVRKSLDEIAVNIRASDSTDSNSVGGQEMAHESTTSETDYCVTGSTIRTTVSTDLLSTQSISQSSEIVPETANADCKCVDNLHKSVDQLNLGKMSSKLPERRVSDVTGMHRKSIIHKQGSRTLGSRIASVDYADPKTLLFTHNSNNNNQMLMKKSSVQSLQMQRDSSVFSLTSSNDSVNISIIMERSPYEQFTPTIMAAKSPLPKYSPKSMQNELNLSAAITTKRNLTSTSTSSSDDSYYEKNVETCLEDGGIFRDSAIYSDDNNDKPYTRPEHIYSTIDEVKQNEKPVLPPKLQALNKTQCVVARTAPPPPLPAKPKSIPITSTTKIGKSIEKSADRTSSSSNSSLSTNASSFTKSNRSLASKSESTASMRTSINTPPALDIAFNIPIAKKAAHSTTESFSCHSMQTDSHAVQPPPIPVRNMNNKNSSWVLKQIQNFDK